MSDPFPVLDTAPRNLEGLLSLKRGIRTRLSMQVGFRNENEEMAFLHGTDAQQANWLLKKLEERDMPATFTIIISRGTSTTSHLFSSEPYTAEELIAAISRAERSSKK